MTDSDDTLERKIDAVAEEVSSMHTELPDMIATAVDHHETTYVHMTPEAYREMFDEILTNQHYIAEVVLGPEFTNYDGEVERSGGLQDLVAEYQNGEIKTRLTTRDRVALYIAAIGGFTAIVTALIVGFT